MIGTTGLSPEQSAEIHAAAKKVPILWAANMAVGVNVLLSLVEKTAAMLDPAYDIEVLEMHHRHKIDAPSGTARPDQRGGFERIGQQYGQVETLAAELICLRQLRRQIECGRIFCRPGHCQNRLHDTPSQFVAPVGRHDNTSPGRFGG